LNGFVGAIIRKLSIRHRGPGAKALESKIHDVCVARHLVLALIHAIAAVAAVEPWALRVADVTWADRGLVVVNVLARDLPPVGSAGRLVLRAIGPVFA